MPRELYDLLNQKKTDDNNFPLDSIKPLGIDLDHTYKIVGCLLLSKTSSVLKSEQNNALLYALSAYLYFV